MQFTKITGIIYILLLSCYTESLQDSACGDWLAYRDEKCFKILDDTLRTFDDAKTSCQHLTSGDALKFETTPSLVVINSQEEQDLLIDYLFNSNKNVENFWIGCKFSPVEKRFKWIDESELNFTNWDLKGPRNQADYCVEMEADKSTLGKWLDVPCEKKNLVVCERVQTWSLERLQKALLEERAKRIELGNKVDSLTEQKQDVEKKLEEFQSNLEAREQETNKKMEAFQTLLTAKEHKFSQKIDTLQKSFSLGQQESTQKIEELQKSLISTKQECDRKIEESYHNLTVSFGYNFDEINKKISDILSHKGTNQIPVGFIYAQLPKEKSPVEIWPETKWIDVSETYAGVFFRVAGGDSNSFGGETQSANAPRVNQIKLVHSHHSSGESNPIDLPVGDWSDHIMAGGMEYQHHGGNVFWQFHTTGGEVRPVNMAIRIWKRTN